MKCQYREVIGLRNHGVCILRGGGLYNGRHHEDSLLNNSEFKDTLSIKCKEHLSSAAEQD